MLGDLETMLLANCNDGFKCQAEKCKRFLVLSRMFHFVFHKGKLKTAHAKIHADQSSGETANGNSTKFIFLEGDNFAKKLLVSLVD